MFDESAGGAVDSELPLRVYRPVKRRIRLSELVTTLSVARMIGIRDIKAKYKQAALGPLWLMIGPLGMLLAVTVAFYGVTQVNTAPVPYVVFALTGLIVWTYVQLSTTLGAVSIINNGGLVRRSPIPRIALISGSLLGNLPPFAVMLVTTLVAAGIAGRLTLNVLVVPVLVAWLFVFSMFLSMILGALAARFRDVVSILPLIIQAGIFVSPVGYSLHGAPENIHTLLVLNPVSGLIEAWRWAVLDMPNTELTAIAVAVAWTVALTLAGWRIFGRLEVSFADFV
ncbi:MAG TPA: ABC transporter permease [Solirubrobacteraceae bacterium]|nr:ABC transporter permease [Solirubrobacteraceae bacterium]